MISPPPANKIQANKHTQTNPLFNIHREGMISLGNALGNQELIKNFDNQVKPHWLGGIDNHSPILEALSIENFTHIDCADIKEKVLTSLIHYQTKLEENFRHACCPHKNSHDILESIKRKIAFLSITAFEYKKPVSPRKEEANKIDPYIKQKEAVGMQFTQSQIIECPPKIGESKNNSASEQPQLWEKKEKEAPILMVTSININLD